MKAQTALLFTFLIAAAAMLNSCTNEQEEYSFKEGDLFFQDLDCGPFCEAIEKVTQGYLGSNLSHVGVLIRHENSWKILEAGGEGVRLTAVDTFLNRSFDRNGKPKVLVGRMENIDQRMLKTAKTIGISLVGKPYDDFFDIENEAFYCSELIYESFRDQAGNPLFELKPMTFKDPETNSFFPIWEDYFADLKMEIPEGSPGLNPGAMSTASSVQIVYQFGEPSGLGRGK